MKKKTRVVLGLTVALIVGFCGLGIRGVLRGEKFYESYEAKVRWTSQGLELDFFDALKKANKTNLKADNFYSATIVCITRCSTDGDVVWLAEGRTSLSPPDFTTFVFSETLPSGLQLKTNVPLVVGSIYSASISLRYLGDRLSYDFSACFKYLGVGPNPILQVLCEHHSALYVAENTPP